jgi:hypothetical protein
MQLKITSNLAIMKKVVTKRPKLLVTTVVPLKHYAGDYYFCLVTIYYQF